MVSVVTKFFDRLEDKIRAGLSHYPITYAIFGGIGVVLFWRGVWHTADLFPFMTGPVSTLIGAIILLLTGLFVSFFIGDNIMIAGLKREKKLAEKTELEIETEKDELDEVREIILKMERDLEEIKGKIVNNQ
ncbi:MAG: hypothetical protein Q7S05_03875 [bacterium]|nr:hypothetical protein [bacterium]